MARFKRFNNQSVYITNGTPTKSIFSEREKYNKLYPKGFGFPKPIDFFTEKNRKYGMLDQRKNILIPNSDFLFNIGGTKEREIFVFDFVADAFRDFLHYINGKINQRLIDDGGKIKKKFKAHKGWQDITSIREKYDEANYNSFVTSYLKYGNKHRKIKDFSDFIEIFMNGYTANMLNEIPMTTQGIILSNITSPMASALCIEISEKDKSNQFDMFNTYINNKNYKTYLMAAANFGFMVDKNVPYRLVANLGSPKMMAYLELRLENFLYTPRSGTADFTDISYVPKENNQPFYHDHTYQVDEYGNGFTSTIKKPSKPEEDSHLHQIKNFIVQDAQGWSYPDGVPTGILPHSHGLPKSPNAIPWDLNTFFGYYYLDSSPQDVAHLSKTLRGFYNKYVEQFPFVKDIVPCGAISSREIAIKRLQVGSLEYSEEYETLFFIKLFYLIRLKELNAEVEPDAIAANIKKIDNLYNLVDKASALEYITTYLKQFY